MGLDARVRVAREHSFEAASERIGDLIAALIRRRRKAGAVSSSDLEPVRVRVEDGKLTAQRKTDAPA